MSRALASIACAWLLVAAPAHAQVDFSQIQDVARVKAEEGLALYGEQRWQEAHERFRVAEQLFHAPTLLLYMAHCQRELGRLLEARRLYRRIADEPVPADAPEAFREAHTTAREQVAALGARIAKLRITVRGPALDRARVTLDGQLVPLAPAEVEVDPGKHELQATAPGVEAAEQRVELAEGAQRDVTLELKAPPPPLPPRPEPEGSFVPAAIALGVGGAGLTLGAVTGGLVRARVADIRESCDGNTCPDRLAGEADDAQPLATAANVGFIVGGAGVAAAVVLFIVPPVLEEPGAASSTLRVYAGPTGAGVAGSF